MPTPTYTLIEEQVLSSAQASVTLGSGGTISQAYRDLVVEYVGTMSSIESSLFRLNGDTGTNYSLTYLAGNGSTATSSRSSSLTVGLANMTGTNKTAMNTWYFAVQSYANTNTYKTTLGRSADAGAEAFAAVNLWRSTSAVTSITLLGNNSATFAAGSTFRLWGV